MIRYRNTHEVRAHRTHLLRAYFRNIAIFGSTCVEKVFKKVFTSRKYTVHLHISRESIIHCLIYDEKIQEKKKMRNSILFTYILHIRLAFFF